MSPFRITLTSLFIVGILGCGNSHREILTPTTEQTREKEKKTEDQVDGQNPAPEPEPPEASPPGVDRITFATIQDRIFQPHCISCHSDSGGNRGRVNLETFSNTLKHLDEVVSEVNQGSMPPRRPLPQELIDLLNQWYQDGAPEAEEFFWNEHWSLENHTGPAF